MAEKHEFASPGWFGALHETMKQMAESAGASGMDGVQWTACEVFTDVPEHLAQTPDGKAAWHCRVRGSEIEFGLGEIDESEADFKVVADYQSVLPFARMVIGDDPESEARINDLLGKAAVEGKIRIHGSRESRPEAFAKLHDEMVKVTA